MPAWWQRPEVMAALGRELVGWGAGCRVQRIRQLDARAVALDLYQRGVTRTLLLDGSAGRMELRTESPPREPATPPPFQGLLRKHFLNSRLLACEPLGVRAVRVVFETLSGPRALCVEWPGGAAGNVLMLTPDARVMGAADPSLLKARGLRMGQPYVPPGGEAAALDALPTVDAALLAAHPLVDVPTHALLALVDAPASAPVVVAVANPLRRRLKAEVDRLVRLLRALHADLEKTHAADPLRAAAERAKVGLGALPRGVDQWVLPDPWDPAGTELTVAVDPALGPAQNVEKLFHRARRLDRTAAMTRPRLEDAQARLDRVKAALAAVDAASPDADALAGALLAEAPRRPQTRGEGPSRRMPFRAFRTASGFRVLVGKGRMDNDQLTLRTARGRDVFLHARDFPGAHVILVVEGKAEAPQSAIHHAALLAAHFSDARGETAVDVRWTQVKHVRGVSGTPGLVTLAQERVLRVRPSDAALAPMLATEEGADSRL